MIKLNAVLRDSLIIAVIFTGLQLLHAFLLKDALFTLQHLSDYRLCSSVAGVLNQAHKAKDDLAIVEVVNTLTQAPGVVKASVGESDTPPRLRAGYVAYPLKEGDRKWGYLAVLISDHASQKLVKRQALAGMAAAGVVWVGLCLYLQFIEKRRMALIARMSELDGLLEIEKRRRAAMEDREKTGIRQSAACLQKAVERIRDPLIVLDSQQRVAALNTSALSWLKISDAAGVLQKSWLDVPLLSTCGSALEKSLASPGKGIPCPLPDRDEKLIFNTESDGLTGTWIELISSQSV